MKISALSLLLCCSTIAFAAETPSNNPPADHSTAVDTSNKSAPVDHSAIFQHSEQAPPVDIESMLKAEVVSVVDTKGYTYIEITRDDEPLWLAVPTTEVKAGDTVHYGDGPVVRDYQSQTLKKTFPTVLFLLSVVVNYDK